MKIRAHELIGTEPARLDLENVVVAFNGHKGAIIQFGLSQVLQCIHRDIGERIGEKIARSGSETWLEDPVFMIEFMYKANYMIISYRPEWCGIWHWSRLPTRSN